MKYVPNPKLDEQIERQVPYVEALARASDEGVEAAKVLAPVRLDNYRKGLKTVRQGPKVFASGTWFTSHFIEWGTIDTPIFAPLRRGVRAVGLKFKERRK